MARMGRPLRFKSPEEFQKQADEYFESLQEEHWEHIFSEKKGRFIWVQLKDRKGKPVMRFKETPTITGLALFLNTSRETLMNAERSPLLTDVVRKVKDKIEYYYEIADEPAALKIFKLKNFDWEDKSHVDTTVKGTHIIASVPVEERIEMLLAEKFQNALC